MAKRRKGRSRTPKLDRAKAVIRSMTTRGAVRATLLHATVLKRAGVSTRTYRTARKQLQTIAIRRGKRHGKRGTGRWWTKGR